MRIVLFDGIGNIGIVIDPKPRIDNSALRFDVDRQGMLRVGVRTYEVSGGAAYVPTFNLIMGEAQAISFTDEAGKTFTCGEISRTGSHMIKITNPVEPCIVALCETVDKLTKKTDALEGELNKIKNEHGVSFM